MKYWRFLPLFALLLCVSCCMQSTNFLSADSIDPIPDQKFQDASPSTAPPRGVTVDGVVVRIIDGDTLVVRTHVDYHVRLLDCWAPESRTTDVDEKKLGLKARNRMIALADSQQVRVHIPIQSGDLSRQITLGRILGRVWLKDPETGQISDEDLSRQMVREGLAKPAKETP